MDGVALIADRNEKEYRPPVMRKIGGGLLFAIGLLVTAFTIFFAVKDLPLWVFGKHTQAVVVDTWVERIDNLGDREEGELKFAYYLRYQFTLPGGQVITKDAKASATEWSSMAKGAQIDIVYFPLYPHLNRLDDSRWVLFLSCTYIPLIVVSLIGLRVGWYMLTSP